MEWERRQRFYSGICSLRGWRLKTSLQVQPQTDSLSACEWFWCSSRTVSRKHFFPELNTNSGEPCQAPHRDTIHEIEIGGMKGTQGKQAPSISDKYVCLMLITVWVHVPIHIHTEARAENMLYIFLCCFLSDCLGDGISHWTGNLPFLLRWLSRSQDLCVK